MSLYNMLFGQNPAADILLAMVGLSRGDVGRYRDCYTNEDGSEIIIHTRNGGGNRDDYQQVFDALSKHPNYLRDSDDDFDCTYADIIFSVPEPYRTAVKQIADVTDTTPPEDKWKKLLGDLESGKDTAVVSRALEISKKIFGQVESGTSGEVKTEKGLVSVTSVPPRQ
jgi:hypothetical protein